jgi:hypothetical protein
VVGAGGQALIERDSRLAIHLHEGKAEGMILYGDHTVERRVDQTGRSRGSLTSQQTGIATRPGGCPT